MRLVSLILAVVGVVVCAWFGVVARQAHEIDAASAILAPASANRYQLRDAASLIRSAAVLDPGQDVPILRARLELKSGQDSLARRTLASVTRAEPDNLDAWIQVGVLAVFRKGSVNVANVKKQLKRLDPLDARSLS
jgi:hypothetical protein